MNIVLVTKKEYIYETASEDDEKEKIEQVKSANVEVEAKKTTLKKSASTTDSEGNDGKPTKSTTNGRKNKKAPSANQPTMLSFFKKN